MPNPEPSFIRGERERGQVRCFFRHHRTQVERSAAQEREWLAILDEASDFSKNKKLIPLVVGHAELPNFLKNWESLAVPSERQQWSKFIETTVKALRSDSRPRFVPVPKADLKQWQHRRESIAAMAKQLKALGH